MAADESDGGWNVTFKEWLKLQEVGTGTNSVAIFSRPIFNKPFRRRFLGAWGEEDPFFKKKNEAEVVPNLYGSSMVDGGTGTSLPTSPLKAVSSAAQTLPQSNTPTLAMPVFPKKKFQKRIN